MQFYLSIKFNFGVTLIPMSSMINLLVDGKSFIMTFHIPEFGFTIVFFNNKTSMQSFRLIFYCPGVGKVCLRCIKHLFLLIFPICFRLFPVFFCFFYCLPILLFKFVLNLFQFMKPSLIILFVTFYFLLQLFISVLFNRCHLISQLIILLFQIF